MAAWLLVVTFTVNGAPYAKTFPLSSGINCQAVAEIVLANPVDGTDNLRAVCVPIGEDLT